ncbi:MAG: lipid II:glycine glycyltransferase FemX [Blastocatellia bacterium]
MTNRWEILSDARAAAMQDRGLLGLGDYSLFQTRGWGEYFRAQGWEIRRWAAFTDKGEIASLAQGSVKRFPLGFGIVWIEGGPVGDMALWNEDFRQTIVRTTGLPRLYCRFRCDRPRDGFDALGLTHQGWARALYPLTSNLSLSLDLTRPEDEFMRGLSRQWRRNLRKAETSGLRIRRWLNPDVDEVCAAYTAMESYKKLHEQFSRERLELLLKQSGMEVVLYRCEDAHRRLLSLRGCGVLGRRAWDLLAAMTEEGRGQCASYPLFLALLAHCRAAGIAHYDLGGIDPVENPGVYQFKSGTGAAPLEYLGEWDWATAPWLRVAANAAIHLRARRRQGQKREAAPAPVNPARPTPVNPVESHLLEAANARAAVDAARAQSGPRRTNAADSPSGAKPA